MKERAKLLAQFWRPMVIGLALAVVIFLLLIFHLGIRPAALSQPEVNTRLSSQSLRTIINNPINAPLKLPELLFMTMRPASITASRITAAIYGVITMLLLFWVLRLWQGNLVATLGTIMFGTSSWFLHTARLNTPEVLLYGIVAIIAVSLWLKHTLRRNLITIISAVTVAVAFYIPGLLWFIAAAAVWFHKTLWRELKHTKNITKIVSIILLVVLVLPLIWALYHSPAMAWTLAGLPSHMPSWHKIISNLINIPINLFWHGPNNPVRWLGNLPILDIFAIVMLVFGTYAYWVNRKLYRSRIIFGASILGILLIASGGPVTVTLLMPIIYIVIATGVLYLLESWYSVFPRNPVARSTGLAIIILAVSVSCAFQLKSYFISWQQAPATKAVFNQPATDVISKKAT